MRIARKIRRLKRAIRNGAVETMEMVRGGIEVAVISGTVALFTYCHHEEIRQSLVRHGIEQPEVVYLTPDGLEVAAPAGLATTHPLYVPPPPPPLPTWLAGGAHE